MSDRLTKKQVERALNAWRDAPPYRDLAPVVASDMINALDELLELRRVGDEVVTQLSAERLALRARVAELEAEAARRDAPEPDGWLTLSPHGLEWHGTRDHAEAFVLDWYTDNLYEGAEAHPERGYVLRVVAHTVGVVESEGEDDDGGFDYLISGYRLAPGSGGSNAD